MTSEDKLFKVLLRSTFEDVRDSIIRLANRHGYMNPDADAFTKEAYEIIQQHGWEVDDYTDEFIKRSTS
jgi:hypothetical protein